MSWQIDAQTMNAETITAICYLYIFSALIASIWAAQILERRLKTRLPQTLPYRWGYYFGCMGLACAPFAVLFACLAIIFAAYEKAELFGEYLVYTAYFLFRASARGSSLNAVGGLGYLVPSSASILCSGLSTAFTGTIVERNSRRRQKFKLRQLRGQSLPVHLMASFHARQNW